MTSAQPGILADETHMARYMAFTISSDNDVISALKALLASSITDNMVVGVGSALVKFLGKEIPGLGVFQATTGNGIDIPSTPSALWFWLRGNDRGEIYHRSRQLESKLAPGFILNDVIDSFQFDKNRDLTGYEDGTENPEADEAVDVAIIQNQGAGMDGGSFVAVQQWLHDFEMFDSMSTEEMDDVIGRHRHNNEEFDEAPESAHVKRAAQESYSPEAFLLRRSMPWSEGMEAGLVFVAFGKSFDAFEAILNRMIGNDDSISDALFTISRPVSGAYFWCPPLKSGKLDLSLLGL